MKFNLPPSIDSGIALQAVISEIKEYARWLSHEQIKQQAGGAAGAAAAPALSHSAAELLRSGPPTGPTSAQLEELAIDLEQLLGSAPQIHITLAAVPSAGFKKTLVAWCREQLGPTTLVDFGFNSTLLGGMVVRSGSRIYDWSFRRQIIAGRARFAEVLRRV